MSMIELKREFMGNLRQVDADVYKAITNELERQQNNLELIASENIVR